MVHGGKLFGNGTYNRYLINQCFTIKIFRPEGSPAPRADYRCYIEAENRDRVGSLRASYFQKMKTACLSKTNKLCVTHSTILPYKKIILLNSYKGTSRAIWVCKLQYNCYALSCKLNLEWTEIIFQDETICACKSDKSIYRITGKL